ncbi:MAG: lamin tail domain-containing protein, partial [Shewanellaceae bacterium]|nr:lamin tail domain-containing protein [Shewanellaceae bacterium]
MQYIKSLLQNSYLLRLLLVNALFGCGQLSQSNPTSEPQPPFYLSQCPVVHHMPSTIHHLLITEIGEPQPGYQDWIEIYNASSEPLLLSEYTLRTQYQSQYGEKQNSLTDFVFPNKWLEPYSYYVVFATHSTDRNHWSNDLTTDYLTKIQQDNTMYTLSLQKTRGSVELLRNDQTVDFVRYGANFEAPKTALHWQGGSAPALGHPLRFSSLMRKYPYEDTQSSYDWVVSSFATKGGINDIDPYDLA